MADATVRAVLQKVSDHGMIRHINGNTHDNRVENLQWVTVLQAFQNKDWTVDAVCILNDEEFKIWCKARKEWVVMHK